jgi:copper chaperone NosL
MNKQGLIFLATGLLLTACTFSPSPIEYGSDMCVYCKMSIVDKQYAARAVTNKGKAYKFDAIECMVPFLASQSEITFTSLDVNDYDRPGHLIPAEDSYYLISRNLPSPMGAFLTGFATEERALAMKSEKGGEVYTWETLILHLSTH